MLYIHGCRSVYRQCGIQVAIKGSYPGHIQVILSISWPVWTHSEKPWKVNVPVWGYQREKISSTWVLQLF